MIKISKFGKSNNPREDWEIKVIGFSFYCQPPKLPTPLSETKCQNCGCRLYPKLHLDFQMDHRTFISEIFLWEPADLNVNCSGSIHVRRNAIPQIESLIEKITNLYQGGEKK